MGLIIFLIFIASFFIAYRSMEDLEAPKELKNYIKRARTKGTILFLKKKIRHYSSSLSSSSEE